jgi:FixJ family two-component response regulator
MAARIEDGTSKKKRKIMLVDDEQDINSMLKIEDNGFGVDSFADPIIALNNYKAGLYDKDLFFQKPIAPDDLVKEIKKMLNISAASVS